MYIELIDLLRCPKEHADSWLVAAFNLMDGRFVIEGKLGCPVCSATYFIRDGLVDLREEGDQHAAVSRSQAHPDDESAIRAAALLGLTKPNSIVVLAGGSANLSDQISEIGEARVLVVNPRTAVHESERVALILADDRLPFAPGSIDGIIIDEATTVFGKDAARVLRQGGRLVAPAGTDLPAGFRELARDYDQVVAESIGELITLSR
jgi:uncharacterized protein YbaR (Trm112 family)